MNHANGKLLQHMQNRSLPSCEVVTALEKIVLDHSFAKDSLADVANCAIGIVHDMQESGITEYGLQTFYELASIVLSQHGQSLDHYLHNEVANCEICRALKIRFPDAQPHQASQQP